MGVSPTSSSLVSGSGSLDTRALQTVATAASVEERAASIVSSLAQAPAADRAALARDLSAALDDAALGALAGNSQGREALRALDGALHDAPDGVLGAGDQQARVARAAAGSDDGGGVLGQVGGFFGGLWEVGSETVGGVVDLAGGAASTVYDTVGGAVVDGSLSAYSGITGDSVGKADWLPDFNRGVGRLETAGNVIGTIVQNPGVLVDAVVDPIRQDWSAGRYGEAIGRGVGEVIGLVVGPKGATRAADAAGDVARLADDVADAGRVARKADDIARVADDLPPRLPAFSDGARHVDPATGRTVIDASRGSTGDWSRALDQAIEPNAIYRTDNGYRYHTDAQSRVEQVQGELQLDYEQPRWPHRQDTVVRENGEKGAGVTDPDQGGHLIARMFGGPGESINLVPMRGSINQGNWGTMEKTVEDLLKDGYQVQADIRLQYPETGLTRRPDKLDVELSITDADGNVRVQTYEYDNRRPEP
jgi:hypothetical protein